MGGNFREEPGAALEWFAVAAVETDERIAQMQMVASPRDGHVEKSPFLLERIGFFQRARTREHSFGQPDDKNRTPLEPFGLVLRTHPVKLPDAPISVFWHAKVHREPVNQWLRGMVFELFGGDAAAGGGLP